MKITLLLRYFNVGGLERVVSSLANEYISRGYDTQIVVIYSGRNNSLITELDPRVKIIILEGSYYSKLKILHKLTEGRLVHIHFGNGKIFPLIRMALVGRKKVITYHSNYSHKRNWIKNRIDQIYASKLDGIIAVSDAVKEFCVNDVHIKKDRIKVIHNGIDIKQEQHTGSQTKDIVLISLSNLFPHKNQGIILDALAVAKKNGLSVKLKMMGDGPKMSELYKKCVDLGLRDNVDWYGAIWRKDYVHNIIKNSDCFVSASRFEGFPISILEGMAYGLPMILSNIEPHKELAVDSALYFEKNDPEGLYECLKKITEDKKLFSDLSKKSFNQYQAYSLSQCADMHLEVYKKAMN